MLLNLFSDPAGNLVPVEAWKRTLAIQLLYAGQFNRLDQLATLYGWGNRTYTQQTNGIAPPRWVIYESPTKYEVVLGGTNNLAQYPPQALGYIGTQGTLPMKVNFWFQAIMDLQVWPQIVANCPNQNKQLVFFGHSYGGALAQLAAWQMFQNRPNQPIAVGTIGQPRVWVEGGETPRIDMVRIAVLRDPVVHLPPAGNFGLVVLPGPFNVLSLLPQWRHYGLGFNVDTGGSWEVYNNFYEDPLQVAITLAASNAANHDSQNYRVQLYNQMTPQQRADPSAVAAVAIINGGTLAPNPVANPVPPPVLNAPAAAVENWFGLTPGIIVNLAQTVWYSVSLMIGQPEVTPPVPGLVPPFLDPTPQLNPTVPSNPQAQIHPNVFFDP